MTDLSEPAADGPEIHFSPYIELISTNLQTAVEKTQLAAHILIHICQKDQPGQNNNEEELAVLNVLNRESG